MAAFELPDMPTTPQVSPYTLVGAASPLWGYFAGAAASGVAYWWMTRWTQPANLEALFGRAVVAPALPVTLEAAAAPVAEAVAETAETVAETAIAAVEEVAETAAEAAPEALAEALPEAPVGGEAAPISPVMETFAVAPEPEPTPEPAPPMEATADPLPEPVAKPRARKSPANGLEA